MYRTHTFWNTLENLVWLQNLVKISHVWGYIGFFTGHCLWVWREGGLKNSWREKAFLELDDVDLMRASENPVKEFYGQQKPGILLSLATRWRRSSWMDLASEYLLVCCPNVSSSVSFSARRDGVNYAYRLLLEHFSLPSSLCSNIEGTSRNYSCMVKSLSHDI